MIMRLFGLFLLLTTDWQSQISAATEDPEKFCPCLPPKLCPRIFGLSPVDSKQIGQLPGCNDLTTVRCCGASLTVITEHLGTTKYDPEYLRLGKSPVYVPAKINPIPIPENVMRQIEELSTDDGSKIEKQNLEAKTVDSAEKVNHSVQNDIEDGNSSTTKSSTTEKTFTTNDVTTSPPTQVDSTVTSLKSISTNCDRCNQSDINSSPSTAEYTMTEKHILISNSEMGSDSLHSRKEDNNRTEKNLANMGTNEKIESSSIITIVGESIDPSSTTVLSDRKLDLSSTVEVEEMGKINVNASTDLGSNLAANETTGSSNGSIAIVHAQPYNIKTMRNLEMPQELYIILPNEETVRMLSENVSNGIDDKFLKIDGKINNSSLDQSNEIEDDENDQIQNATNRQDIIEKHLDSIVFEKWENDTKSVVTEKNVSDDKLVENSSKGMLETTTETKNKRPKLQQIRHNLYTRKPNSSILLQSRNRINEVSTTTASTTTAKDTVMKKDESVIRREEIERISNLTRDQAASGSEYVPVVVRKPPPPQYKEPSRARAESKVEEDESDVPPVRVAHFRHPPRVLKPVTTTKQPPAAKEERKNVEGDGAAVNGDYDYGDAVEEGEETNNDEVVFKGEEVSIPQGQSRRRQQVIARSRGGNLFKKPPTDEEDKSDDTSEEERMAAMHEFKKLRGQSKFTTPIIESKSTEATLINRGTVKENSKHDKTVDTQIPRRARVRTSTRTETVTIPDSTTVLPVITSTPPPTKFYKIHWENISTTEGTLLFQEDDYTQDGTLLETMEPRNFDSEHTQQVKPIEVYEGKRLNPILKNPNQEVYTGRRLVERKKNFENVNTEDKVHGAEVYTGRKLSTTTRTPIAVASNRNSSPDLENVEDLGIIKLEDKPSITDEINDKETRQQNSGLQTGNQQRLRKNRLQVAPKTPQPSRNVNDGTQTVNEPKEQTATPQSTTEPLSEQKSDRGNFRGNFLRSRSHIGMIEMIIREKMLMEHAALNSRMSRNTVVGATEEPLENQYGNEEGQSRGGRLSHDYPRKSFSEGQNFNDQDLESDGTEQRSENRQVPIGFKPPTRMERGFVPINVIDSPPSQQNLRSTSAFTEDGIPVKQLQLPEESEPPQSFNKVQSFEKSLNVVGPLPNGFHHQNLKSTSEFTEDGVPVQQLHLPEESKPIQTFTEGQLLQNQNSNSSTEDRVLVKELQIATELKPPHSSTEVQTFQKHEEENINQKAPTMSKRTLTELVPPVIEAIFFRRSYDDTLVDYNEALMKYNEYIIKFLQHQRINPKTHEEHVDEVKGV